MFRLMATSTALLSFTDHDEALVNVEADFSIGDEDNSYRNSHDDTGFANAVVGPAVQASSGAASRMVTTKKIRKKAQIHINTKAQFKYMKRIQMVSHSC